MRVLCIGESNMETVCPISSTITDGAKISVEEKFESGGGSAGNVAYLLGKWGVETYIASMVGSDDIGNKIKKEYETIGVKTDYIETNFEKGTSTTTVLINQETKSNTIIEVINNVYLKKYSFNIEPDIIVADGNEFNATVSAFDKYAKTNNFVIANKYTKEIIELCRYAKNIVFNMAAAEGMSGAKIDFNDANSIVNVYNKIKQKFTSAEIVITLGDRGVAYSINDQIKILPPLKVDVVDNHGAGDVFIGAYVYAMGRGFGLERSLCYATIAASLSTTKMTVRGAMPALSEVSAQYDAKFGAQNNPMNQLSNQAASQATPTTETQVASQAQTQAGQNDNTQNA